MKKTIRRLICAACAVSLSVAAVMSASAYQSDSLVSVASVSKAILKIRS